MIDRNKIIKALITLAAVFVGVIVISKFAENNSLTLTEYAQENPDLSYTSVDDTDTNDTSASEAETIAGIAEEETDEYISLNATESTTEILQNEDAISTISTLTGAVLNAGIPEDQRISYTESFYYEPLSDNLRRYITGVSFPAVSGEGDENAEESGTSEAEDLAVSYEDLRYVHILHYDFDGNLAEGELICHEYIAQDLVEIFHELYLNEYQLERVRLIDEYDGDDTASMEDNNTSCFNYRLVEGSTSLSKHALGLAIDVNPLYNPYITYNEDGSENVSPVGAKTYADRDLSFPYKIDENDLCYKLFTEHGFTWGGNWNSCKDYQHFQKVMPR